MGRLEETILDILKDGFVPDEINGNKLVLSDDFKDGYKAGYKAALAGFVIMTSDFIKLNPEEIYNFDDYNTTRGNTQE